MDHNRRSLERFIWGPGDIKIKRPPACPFCGRPWINGDECAYGHRPRRPTADPNDPLAYSLAEERQRNKQYLGGIVLDDSGEVHEDDPAERRAMQRGIAASEALGSTEQDEEED